MGEEIKLLSNNVFDLGFLSKKEFIENIDNLIKVVDVITNNEEINEEIDEETLVSELIGFGIVSEENNIPNIVNILGKERFKLLKETINIVHLKQLKDNPIIQKFNLQYRNKLSSESNKSTKPTLVDLFCGSGGLSLGLTQSGFQVIFANDIEKSALRTYQFNHPEISKNSITMGGIESIAHNVHEYIDREVDVLAGGPPCQGFSMANRQRIIDDPRNILYKYYVECVKNLSPKFFVMENVKGMMAVADQVIEDFNNGVPVEYDISYKLMNAKNFGVPQNRERLIFIGIRNDLSTKLLIDSKEILETIETNELTNFTPLIDAINDLPKRDASRIRNSTEIDSDESGKKIDVLENKKSSLYLDAINLHDNSKVLFNHKARYNNDRDIEIFGRMLPGDKSDSPRIADIMPYKSRSHMFKDKYFKLLPDQPSKTITAHMKFDCNMYIHPYQARGLTPREAARVQSYPDSYFFLGPYTKTYQQIGNSVPPLMSRRIGTVIYSLLERLR